MIGRRGGLGLLGGLAALSMSAPAAAADSAPVTTAQMEANKRLVLDFWRVVIEAKDLSHVADYMAPDLVQHNPTMTNGIAGFAAFSRTFWKGQSTRPVEPVLRNPPAMVLAEGDLVQLVFRRPTPDPVRPETTYDRFTFDLYRVAGGKIVEHWDNVTKPALKASPGDR